MRICLFRIQNPDNTVGGIKKRIPPDCAKLYSFNYGYIRFDRGGVNK